MKINKDNVITTAKLVLNKQDNYVKVETEAPMDALYFLEIQSKDGTIPLLSQLTPVSPLKLETKFGTMVTITTDMIEATSLYVRIVSKGPGNSCIFTNSIPVEIDKRTVLIDLRTSADHKFIELTRKIAGVEKRLEDYSSALKLPTLPKWDKKLAREGMVPTVIDNAGNIALAFPFIDTITSVNNKKAAAKNITLTAKDINLSKSSTSIEDTLLGLFQYVQNQSKTISTLSGIVSEQTAKIGALEAALIDYTNLA